MKTKDWLLIGAIAVGGYIVYKTFIAPNPRAAKDTIAASADYTDYSQFDGDYLARYGQTTYKFSDEDLNKLNLAQRILLALKVPDEWVLQ